MSKLFLECEPSQRLLNLISDYFYYHFSKHIENVTLEDIVSALSINKFSLLFGVGPKKIHELHDIMEDHDIEWK